MLANGKFFFEYFSTMNSGFILLDCAIFTRKIYHRAITTRWTTLHLYKRTRGTFTFMIHWKCPHFQIRHCQFIKLYSKHIFIKRFCS